MIVSEMGENWIIPLTRLMGVGQEKPSLSAFGTDYGGGRNRKPWGQIEELLPTFCEGGQETFWFDQAKPTTLHPLVLSFVTV